MQVLAFVRILAWRYSSTVKQHYSGRIEFVY